MTAHLPDSTESHAPQPSAENPAAPTETAQSSSNTPTEEKGEKANVHIQKYLQQGITEALEKSEKFTNQMEKQAKWFKILAFSFAFFSTCLQIRQTFVGNLSNQQEGKFSAWEMVQNVQTGEIKTSAGLAIALTSLANSCEPLSGVDLTDKYLPSLKIAPPNPNPIESSLSFIGNEIFGVHNQRDCSIDSKIQPLDLRGIIFEKAKLQEAEFTNTNLTGASFQGANLTDAQFIEDSAEKSTLDENLLNLEKVNFQQANLSGVQFSTANLTGANLTGAILLGASLENTKGLTQQQLEGEAAPLICNSTFPQNTGIKIKSDRDCNKIFETLQATSSQAFPSITAAETYFQKYNQNTGNKNEES